MSVIDTSTWGEFRIDALFDVSRPVARSQMNYIEGDIPFVASGNFDNGVVADVEPKNGEFLDSGNCITVSPLDGSAFYQARDFLGRGGAGSAIIMLRNSRLSLCPGLFIAAVIRKSLTKFNYSDQLNKETIAEQPIKLPVTPSGDPDWEYMERVMRDQLAQQEAKLDSLAVLDTAQPTPVDVSEWGEFVIEELFDVHSTLSGIDKNKLNQMPGEIPYVTRSEDRNGITQYISDNQDPRYKKEDANVITVGLDTQTVHYQAVPFFTGQNVHTVAHPQLNKYNSLFIVPCLKAVLKKYNWANGATLGRLKKDIVKLPVTPSGDPDWDYMERVMRDQLAQQEAKLNAFSFIDAAVPMEE